MIYFVVKFQVRKLKEIVHNIDPSAYFN
ncbi:MAG: DUF2179 domain-containing protein [Eubacterium sp.]